MRRQIKIFVLLSLLFLFALTFNANALWVRGYFRSDGTYVHSYYRSNPNNTPVDNYSFKGNINPYTGKVGHNYYRNNLRKSILLTRF
jgi:hypothetical protein